VADISEPRKNPNKKYKKRFFTVKFNTRLTVALVAASFMVMQPLLSVHSQEKNSEFKKLQALLKAQKWYLANRETTRVINENPDNVTCPNLRQIDQLWTKYSEGKYGFTPQLQIWQQVGGTKCETCEDQIVAFSKQVGWRVSSTDIRLIPGEFPGHYPTAAMLGWEGYTDRDRSLTAGGLLSGDRTWVAWRMNGFNLFATFAKCGS